MEPARRGAAGAWGDCGGGDEAAGGRGWSVIILFLEVGGSYLLTDL